MIQNYRNNVLKLIAWLYFAIAFTNIILVLRGKATPDMDLFFLIEVLSIAVLILILLKLKPRSNWAAVAFVVYYILALGWNSHKTIDLLGRISLIRHLFFPSFVFFLVGQKRGILSVLILLVEMTFFLGKHQWNPEILGQAGYNSYLAVLLLSSIAYYAEKVRVKMLEQIDRVGGRDTLTGLANHSGTLITVDRHIKTGQSFQFVLFDMRNFHRANLILGKNDANDLLVAIADSLLQYPEIRYPAHYYGDDFAFLFYGGSRELLSLLENLQSRFEQMGRACRQPVELSATFVYTAFPEDGDTLDTICSNAENALRICKKREGLIHEFDPSLLAQERKDLDYGLKLQNAIRDESLDVWFQPKISTVTNRVSGFEALSRWIDPSGAFVSPQYFIGLAEELGLIDELGLSVFKKSVRFLRKMGESGFSEPSVSVNLSPQQLLSRGFIDQLEEICVENGVSPGQIYLEITESLFVEDDLNQIIGELAERGFLLSLDDFGTGYSNLAYLTKYNFHELKIDKRFVDSLFLSDRDEQLLSTIVSLAKSLSMKIVAEGIETKEQLAKIREFGIEMVQGWIYGKAMPEEESLVFLKDFAPE